MLTAAAPARALVTARRSLPSRFAAVLIAVMFAMSLGVAPRVAAAETAPDAVGVDVVRDVSAGFEDVCVIRPDDTISCWNTIGNPSAPPPSGPFTSVDAGSGACGIRIDRSLECWNGAAPPPGGTFDLVSVGANAACAIRTDETLVCWGGDGPIPVPNGGFASVSAGDSSACGIRSDATLVCWSLWLDSEEQVGAPPSGSFTRVDVYFEKACAIAIDGHMACWWTTGDPAPAMDGTFLELSDTCAIRTDGTITCTVEDGGEPSPVAGTFTTISGSCAIRTDSTLACWDGKGPRPTASMGYGEPWRLSRQVHLSWAAQEGLAPIASYDVRYQRARWDGRFGAWTPLLTESPLTTATVTTTPGYTYCFAVRARDTTGAVSPWTGRDENDMDTGCSASPFDDRLLTRSDGWRALEHEKFYRSTALRTDARGARLTVSGVAAQWVALLVTTCPTCGTLRVHWASSSDDVRRTISLYAPVRRDRQLIPVASPGSVGRGTLSLSVASTGKPVTIDGVLATRAEAGPAWADAGDPPLPGRGGSERPAVGISAGAGHACAIKVDDSLTCWGDDSNGQSSPPPDAVLDVTAQEEDGCAIRLDGTLSCWSADDPWLTDGAPEPPPDGTFTKVDGQCAIRTDASIACWGEADTPPAGTFKDLSVAQYTGCAIRTNGSIACWPDNALSAVPGGVFTAIATGPDHACAIAETGTVECWGANQYGQASPPAGAFTSVSAGALHTCGIRVDGTLACWGDDRFLESTPPSGTFTAVDAGKHFACAIRSDGEGVACWGQNRLGQSVPRPTARLEALPTVSTKTALSLHWRATSLADVTSYGVRYARSRSLGQARTWTRWQTGTAATSGTFTAAPGYLYCFEARGRDTDGRLSPWSSDVCTELPVDDRGMRRAGPWSDGTGSAFYGGTWVRSSTRGATLTRTVVNTFGLGLVATTCPTCGRVRVVFDGTTVKSIDLSSPTRVDRAYFPIWLGNDDEGNLDEPVSGTVKIVVTSTDRKVIIDGLAVRQPNWAGRDP